MPLRSDSENFALIRVIGVGGGGSNAVNRMIRAEMMGVEFIACNTDAQALLQADAPHKIRIGDKITRGLGAGGDAEHRPARGGRGLGEDRRRRWSTRTWSSSPPGSAAGPARAPRPVVAQIAKESGALTIGVVTKPFSVRGRQAQARRREGGRGAQVPGRHPHHDPQRPAQGRGPEEHQHPRRVPRRRRRPAPGRPGHQRHHHHARTHQSRFRRRPRDHEGRRFRADGHRPGVRREPRRRGGPPGDRQPAPRGRHRRRPGHPVQHHRLVDASACTR